MPPSSEDIWTWPEPLQTWMNVYSQWGWLSTLEQLNGQSQCPLCSPAHGMHWKRKSYGMNAWYPGFSSEERIWQFLAPEQPCKSEDGKATKQWFCPILLMHDRGTAGSSCSYQSLKEALSWTNAFCNCTTLATHPYYSRNPVQSRPKEEFEKSESDRYI